LAAASAFLGTVHSYTHMYLNGTCPEIHRGWKDNSGGKSLDLEKLGGHWRLVYDAHDAKTADKGDDCVYL